MKAISLLACAALLAAGAPALAQDKSAMEKAYSETVVPCLRANQDNANPPADDLAACQPLFAAFDAIDAANTSPTPHDLNLRHFYRAYVHTAIGGAYASLDNARTSRVCTEVEGSWREISLIEPGNSPAGFVKNFETMRQSGISTTTKCRSEKGAPPGSPPLP